LLAALLALATLLALLALLALLRVALLLAALELFLPARLAGLGFALHRAFLVLPFLALLALTFFVRLGSASLRLHRWGLRLLTGHVFAFPFLVAIPVLIAFAFFSICHDWLSVNSVFEIVRPRRRLEYWETKSRNRCANHETGCERFKGEFANVQESFAWQVHPTDL
jgi:hypothetical protein